MEDFTYELEQPLDNGFEQECNICRENYSSLPLFRKHMLTHSGDHRAECRVCFARFKEETDLGSHIKSKHIVARASDANDNFYDGHINKQKVLSNVFDDIRPIELKCVKCGIDHFKSWSDFQNHCLLHVSVPSVRVEKLEAVQINRYKPPLKLTLRLAAAARKPAAGILNKSLQFEIVHQNSIDSNTAMNGVTDEDQSIPSQVIEEHAAPQNGEDMFSEVNKALAMLNSSAANEIESELKEEQEDISDEAPRYSAAPEAAVDTQANGYSGTGETPENDEPRDMQESNSETFPVETESSYENEYPREEQFENSNEEFINNANGYGNNSEEYNSNTEVYRDIGDGNTDDPNGYGSEPDGYGNTSVGYGSNTDEYERNPDEYGSNSEGWVGNSENTDDLQNSCTDAHIVPTSNSNVLSMVTNETEFISLNNYRTESSSMSTSPPAVSSVGDPLNTSATSYPDTVMADSSFSDVTYSCHVCSQSFTAQSLLEEHLSVHGEVALKCPVCGEDFQSPGELLQHQEEQHPETMPQQLVMPQAHQSPSQIAGESSEEGIPASHPPPLHSPQQNSSASISPGLQSPGQPHASPGQSLPSPSHAVPSPSQPLPSPGRPLSSSSQPLASPTQLLSSPGGPPSVGNTSQTPPMPPPSTATPPSGQLASVAQPMVTIPAPDGTSSVPRLPPPLYRAPAGSTGPAGSPTAGPISVGPLGRTPQPGPSGMPMQYYGPRQPYSVRGPNSQQMGMGIRAPGQYSNQAPILAQSLQRPAVGPGGQRMSMHPGMQSRNVPSLISGNQQRGAHSGMMQNMRGISPQKRIGAPLPMGQSPNKQQRYGDLGIPARQKDTDCQIIAVQQRSEGLPVIQNVQGASNNENVPRTGGGGSGGPESTIHLTDSITLSVRSTPEKEKPPPQDKNRSDANAVANLLATRGITVTPAANTVKEGSPQKTSSSHLQAPTHSSQRLRNSQPPPPTTTTLNLNSSISIIPAGNSGQSTSQSVQITPVSSRHSRVSHGTANSRVTERPPRPPTVDLTQDTNTTRQPLVGSSGGRMLPAGMNQHRGMPMQNRGWAHPQIPGRHVCQICDKAFTTVDALRSHLVFHQNPNSRLPYTCSLCNAAYPNIHSLQQHRQQYHNEAVNTGSELVIPIVDLKQPGIRAQLHSIGIQSFIPLNQLQNSAGGYFGIPIATMDTLRSGGAHNLKHLGTTSILTLGPMKMLPR